MENRNPVLTGAVHSEGFLYHGHVPCDDSVSPLKQGVLAYWDATAKKAKALDSDAHAATLLGITLGPSKVSSPIDNGSVPTEPNVNIAYGVRSPLNTTVGETYDEGTPVYAGADEQTVTTVAGTNKVGVVRLNPRQGPITGAAGVTVPVLVYSHAFVDFSA